MSTPTQQRLLSKLRSSEVLEVVEEMSPDDRVRLFDELPAKVVRQLLTELSPDERKVTSELLGYRAETAGRLMTTEFIDLKEGHTAEQASLLRDDGKKQKRFTASTSSTQRHSRGFVLTRSGHSDPQAVLVM